MFYINYPLAKEINNATKTLISVLTNSSKKRKTPGNTHRLHLSHSLEVLLATYKNIIDIIFNQTNGIFISIFIKDGPKNIFIGKYGCYSYYKLKRVRTLASQPSIFN